MSNMEPKSAMSVMEDLRRSYDEVPYPDLPKPYTHITQLAAIASMHGVFPSSPEHCSVLELGCADGGNLLPMALRFPQSQFVGVDFSPVQIEIGRRRLESLECSNLELMVADILDLGPDELGCFDFIIVHGVYSWVPAVVQEKILAICRDHLSDNGLAYISYNTYPGWCGKQGVRDILQYHTGDSEDTLSKVEAALSLVAALPDSKDLPGDPGAILTTRLQRDLERMSDPASYLVHEYLIDGNTPLYFSEFVKQIRDYGLRYVDDAFPGSTALNRLPLKAREWIEAHITSTIEQQQYIDFFCNNSFRRSIICGKAVQPDKRIHFKRMKQFHATATCRQIEPQNGRACFVTHTGQRISTGHASLERILQNLNEALPASLSVEDLGMILAGELTGEEAGLMFYDLIKSAAMTISTHPRDCICVIEKRPYTSRLVRYQSLDGVVTNAAHRPVRLENVFERHLLALLDGTRTVDELTVMLKKKLKPDPPMDNAQWKAQIEKHLVRLAELGLLKRGK